MGKLHTMIITNNIRMYRIFLIFIAVILSSISVETIFAVGCDIKTDLPTSTELISSVDRCIKARSPFSKETPNSITEFTCPQAEMFNENKQEINNETLAYLIAVNISFNRVDTDIKKYMQQLQKNREADPIKWIETINICTEKIVNIYSGICTFGILEAKLNENIENQRIQTTNVYPQTLCTNLANKKAQWWRYFQNIMMSDGISKNQKNSTDTWATEVKWAYARVLGNWHTYQKILARAVSKMTGYTKESN